MKYLSPDFYETFKCIGSDCPSTCCAYGWCIYVDEITKKEYDSVTGDFGQKLKDHIQSVEDSLYAFRLKENGRCPFLDTQNLCEIYQELGPEKLCYSCQIYPRITFQHGDIHFRTLTLSCPEVSRILLNRTDPVSFSFAEIPTEEASEPTCIDWNWFNTFLSCFIFSTTLLQNRTYPLSARLRVLLIFTFTLQTLLDENKDVAPLLETFKNKKYLEEQLSSFSQLPSNYSAMFSAFSKFYSTIGAPIHNFIFPSYAKLMDAFINSYDSGHYSDIADTFSLLMDAPHDIQYEHFCVFFLFKNYFHAYEAKKPFEEITQLIYALLVTRSYALPFCSKEKGISTEDQITLFSSTSRIFDHNECNLKKLETFYEKDGQTDIGFLLTLV